MPGFTIHIAVAKAYAKKHQKEIKNMDEFIKGTIDPDYISIENKEIHKSVTHYGIWGDWTKDDQKIYLDQFLQDKKVDLSKDYWKGYFIHLLADDYFDRIYFREEAKQAKKNKDTFHYDYDCLNAKIIKKYNVEVMEKIKKYMNETKEEPKYLKIEKIIQFIEEMSDIDLEQQVKLIEKKNGKDNRHS